MIQCLHNIMQPSSLQFKNCHHLQENSILSKQLLPIFPSLETNDLLFVSANFPTLGISYKWNNKMPITNPKKGFPLPGEQQRLLLCYLPEVGTHILTLSTSALLFRFTRLWFPICLSPVTQTHSHTKSYAKQAHCIQIGSERQKEVSDSF